MKQRWPRPTTRANKGHRSWRAVRFRQPSDASGDMNGCDRGTFPFAGLPGRAPAVFRGGATAGALVRDLAIDHGDVGLNLAQTIARDLQRILGDDDEIGELADLDAALVFLLEAGKRGPDRLHADRVHHGDRFFGLHRRPVLRLPVDGGCDREPGVGREVLRAERVGSTRRMEPALEQRRQREELDVGFLEILIRQPPEKRHLRARG